MEVFDTVGNRTNHEIRDHQLQPRVCDKCGANFFSKSRYDKHILNHNSGFKFKCKECDKGFSQECYLTSHMKKHSPERKYKCASKDCRRCRGFKDVHDLDYHMRTIHSARTEHKCYICDVCFLNEKGLKRHLKV